MKNAKRFFEVCQQQMAKSLEQEEAIDQAAEMIAESMADGGVLHVFGGGHSQMFGEELCYRTGCLVPVNAILVPQYAIYPDIRLCQIMERLENTADKCLEGFVTKPQDIMLIVSISGRNPAGIDMAIAAHKKGMKVIALTSLDYTNKYASRHSSGLKLKDVSDLVLDACGIEGDAVLEDGRLPEGVRFASPSTIVGMHLLIGIMAEVVDRLLDRGVDPEIWVSGNVDHGDEWNSKYLEKYRGRIDIL